MKLFSLCILVASVTSRPQPDFGFEPFHGFHGNRSNFSLLDQYENAKLNAPQIIMKRGYPVEVHTVTTKDNYILTIHRIPYGKKCGPGNGKRVVLLQHGLLCDSSVWVITQPEKGLAYNLADECYDVFMGNFRGNTYSKNHTTLNPTLNHLEFWAFSWHEMGIYDMRCQLDLPAFIDYVLEKTGVDSIYYIGFSQGATSLFVLLSEKPEYNSKIKLICALAPVAYTEHTRSPLALLAGPYAANFDWMLNLLGHGELMPSNELMKHLGLTACHQNSPIKEICSNIFFLACGYDSEQMDRALVPVLLGHLPAGSSVRSAAHFAQGVYSKMFRKYDFRMQNSQIYGSPTPPEYKLELITVPLGLFWGENDWLTTPADVARLAGRLPNLKLNYRIKHDKYNHVDFISSIDNIQLLNKPVIEFMRGF